MFKKIILLLVTYFVFTSSVFAKDDPVYTIEKITNRLMTELQAKNKERNIDQNESYNIVIKFIFPHVDFEEMSRWIMGKKIWNESSVSQRADFIQEFQTLVIRTYTHAVQQYSDATIEFYPLKGSAKANINASRIQISSKMIRNNNNNIMVDYRLIAYGDTWKVYDLVVEGVSILKGFQAQFSEKIKNEGIAKITQEIKKHNQEKNIDKAA